MSKVYMLDPFIKERLPYQGSAAKNSFPSLAVAIESAQVLAHRIGEPVNVLELVGTVEIPMDKYSFIPYDKSPI